MIDKFIGSIRAVYGWHAAATLTALYDQANYNPLRYLARFWTTQNFAAVKRQPLTIGGRVLTDVTAIGMLLQVAVGLWLIGRGMTTTDPAQTLFGAAALIAYPLVWAHILPVLSLPGVLLAVKPLGKRTLCVLLEHQVVLLRKKHAFALVAVAGSVGKTSTKLAIADALSVARRVRYQSGNYNDRLTVPLVLFGHNEPGIYNAFAWIRILLANRQIIRREYPYDVVVIELGTDGPNQMEKFAYLRPELSVLTAIAPEHMEQFGSIDAVAKDELSIFDYSQKVLVNNDDVSAEYLTGREYVSYGEQDSTYALKSARPAARLTSQRVTFDLAGRKVSESINLIGLQGAKIALAAAAVASELALSESDVNAALTRLQPFAGRMQVLVGIKKSTIIDDTYNASPVAVKAALDVLYAADTPQRIALLGNMNELGDFSPQAHTDIGEYCDPSKLSVVVTLGSDANKYLAEAAKQRGCEVKTCANPQEAGEYIATRLQENAVVLAKGSQNRVFAEEAIKPLLQDKADEAKLVRQSNYWMRIKQRQFGA
jgi:UDP-N-acetylmuramoyl-tripeptide--D-alanyl-D-alanine ligase